MARIIGTFFLLLIYNCIRGQPKDLDAVKMRIAQVLAVLSEHHTLYSTIFSTQLSHRSLFIFFGSIGGFAEYPENVLAT